VLGRPGGEESGSQAQQKASCHPSHPITAAERPAPSQQSGWPLSLDMIPDRRCTGKNRGLLGGPSVCDPFASQSPPFAPFFIPQPGGCLVESRKAIGPGAGRGERGWSVQSVMERGWLASEEPIFHTYFEAYRPQAQRSSHRLCWLISLDCYSARRVEWHVGLHPCGDQGGQQ
jgi:hypothetical protein